MILTIDLDDYPDMGNGELHYRIMQSIYEIDPSIKERLVKATLQFKDNADITNSWGMVDTDEYFGKKLKVY